MQNLRFKELRSIDHFKQDFSIGIYYYKHQRRKPKLKGMSPVQYRAHAQQVLGK